MLYINNIQCRNQCVNSLFNEINVEPNVTLPYIFTQNNLNSNVLNSDKIIHRGYKQSALKYGQYYNKHILIIACNQDQLIKITLDPICDFVQEAVASTTKSESHIIIFVLIISINIIIKIVSLKSLLELQKKVIYTYI